MVNFYSVLGVARDATADEIARAFRTVAKQCHPDLWPCDPAREARFKAASEAKTTLLDAERRAAYDRAVRDQEERLRRDVRPFVREHVQPVVDFAAHVYGSNPFVRCAKAAIDVGLGDRGITERDLEDIGAAAGSLFDFLQDALAGRGRVGGDGT